MDGEIHHSDHLIDLEINQNKNSLAWTKFLVAVQGGLGVGYALLFRNPNELGTAMIGFMGVVIPLVGAVSCNLIADVIQRHHRWSVWYTAKYSALPGNDNKVFPMMERNASPKSLEELEPGYISDNLTHLCRIILMLWVAAGWTTVVWVLYRLTHI